MVYNKTKWQDEIPDLTKPILDSSGKQKVDPQTGRPLFELVQTGTRITSAKLNNIEDGISAAHTLTEQLVAEVNGNFVASGLVFTFTELTASWTAGIAYVNGRRFDITAGSLTLTAKQGQYIYMNTSGVILKATTEATARVTLLLWYFATDASKAITSTDMRRIITPDSYAFKSETVAKEDGKGLSKNDYTDADKARVQSHEDKLNDIVPRLNTPATTQLTLRSGEQTIQMDRDKPFNLTRILGRVLLNLLGRSGSCESIAGWAFSGTPALNTANFVSSAGTSSIRITIGSDKGIMSRNVGLTVGKTYVMAASVKLGTAARAFVSVTGIADGFKVTSSTDFTTSFLRFTATSTSQGIAIVVEGTQGQTAYVDAVRIYEVSTVEYNQLANMTPANAEMIYPYTEGFVGVKNPYAIRWTSTAKTHVAAILAFDTELLASPVVSNDAERDRLEQGTDGSYYKTTQWRKLVLGGGMNWLFSTDGNRVGYKKVYFSQSDIAPDVYAINFRQELIPQTAGSVSDYGANMVYVNTTTKLVEFSIAQANSGWGDAYTPTSADIKAYFYGWKMYDTSTSTDGSSIYNRTDGLNKAWARRTNGSDASGGYAEGILILPTTQAAGWTPYELVYKRAAPITEPVVSEGALSLTQGNNTIEIGSGLIIHESVRPYKDGVGWNINNGSSAYESSLLKYKASRFIDIYKNGHRDQWSLFPDGTTAAGVLAQQNDSMYDSNATYSVSYIRTSMFPLADFSGVTPNNERAILDDLTRNMQQLTDRVSVTELRKVEKEQSVNWIIPTFLNAYNNLNNGFYNVGYYKDNNGYVHLRGMVKATGTGFTSMFRLAEGYRPSRIIASLVSGNTDGNTDVIGRVNIQPDGNVLNLFAYSSGAGWISLADIVPFLAEQ